MGGPIGMERKRCELIGCYIYLVTFNSTSTMSLTLEFRGQLLKKAYLRNEMADLHGMKGMWVDRMLDPLYDFQLSPHPWSWPWIFKV